MIPRTVVALTLLGACADRSPSDSATTCEQASRAASRPAAAAVYNGDARSSEVPLWDGQQQAIGTFGRCTGTLIAPRWVLSARHCVLQVGDRFAFGNEQANAASLDVVEVVTHPVLDLALVRLEAPATTALVTVSPIPWLSSNTMAPTWIGRPIESVGFGKREDGEQGLRRFLAAAIVEVSDTGLTIDGRGQRGLCTGDSGGPALVIDDAGHARVAGVLHGGASTCVDRDHIVRTDVASAWIEQSVGPAPDAVAAPCGGGFDEGRCLAGGQVAVGCGDDQRLEAVVCSAPTACGWDPGSSRYRCVAGPDACDGVDALGRCDGDGAHWCDRGVLRTRDCGACDETCAVDLSVGGATCVVDPCDGLDAGGRCEPGGVRVWCEAGQRFEENCAAQGGTCRLVNAELGHQCVGS